MKIVKIQNIGSNDKILIVCSGVDEKLKDKVSNTRYWGELVNEGFKKKGFTKAQIAILPKVTLKAPGKST